MADELNDQGNQNEGKENITHTIPAECKQLRDEEIPSVEEGPWGDAWAAVEKAHLALNKCEEVKQKEKSLVFA